MAKSVVRYVGPHDGVELNLPDGRVAEVAHGELLETTPEHAAALLEQASNWEPAKPSAKAKNAEPAEGEKGGDA